MQLATDYLFTKLYICINPYHTGVSEYLIIRGGGGGTKWPTGENWLYKPYFRILNIKNHFKGLKGHKSCPQQGHWPVLVLHWALHGPLKGPCDFRDSARLCLHFLKKYILWTLWTSWNTFMVIVVLHQGSGNPHGPSWTPKWTLKLTLRGWFWGTLAVKRHSRVPPRSKLIKKEL